MYFKLARDERKALSGRKTEIIERWSIALGCVSSHSHTLLLQNRPSHVLSSTCCDCVIRMGAAVAVVDDDGDGELPPVDPF